MIEVLIFKFLFKNSIEHIIFNFGSLNLRFRFHASRRFFIEERAKYVNTYDTIIKL
jgi:hypothetical protein